jgi:lipid A 3-O-deacylase
MRHTAAEGRCATRQVRRPAQNPALQGCGRNRWHLAVALPLLLLTASTHADALRASIGHGQSIDLHAISLQLDRTTPVREYSTALLTAHVEFGVGEFQGHPSSTSHATTRAFSVLAKLRWEPRAQSPITSFAEFGLGFGVFSDTLLGGARRIGSSVEFREALETGIRFGEHHQYELAVFGQHFSNAGLSHPNQGVTYAGLSAAWYYH